MSMNYKKLGDYIEVLNRRNTDLKLGLDSVRGISNTKQITETSKATVDESVIYKFYVINPGEFVYNPRTTRMGDKVGLALNNTDTPLLFTFNNLAFKIKDTKRNELLPDFLYLFFCRSEFDRYARVNSWGSATELFLFDALCEMKLPIPDFTEQQRIVNAYKTVERRIHILQQINEKLEESTQTIFKILFKSNTEKNNKTIGDYIIPKRGKNLLSRDAVTGDVPVIAGGIEPSCFHNVANTTPPVLTISASGVNAGFVNIWEKPVWSSDSSYIDSTMTQFVYFWYTLLKNKQNIILESQTGSAQPHIYPQHIALLEIQQLDMNDVSKYCNKVTPFFKIIGNNKEEINNLRKLQEFLISCI